MKSDFIAYSCTMFKWFLLFQYLKFRFLVWKSFQNIFFDEFSVTSSIVMWNRFLWYWTVKKFTKRLPSILDIPNKKVFFRYLLWFNSISVRVHITWLNFPCFEYSYYACDMFAWVEIPPQLSLNVLGEPLKLFWKFVDEKLKKWTFYVLFLVKRQIRPGAWHVTTTCKVEHCVNVLQLSTEISLI